VLILSLYVVVEVLTHRVGTDEVSVILLGHATIGVDLAIVELDLHGLRLWVMTNGLDHA